VDKKTMTFDSSDSGNSSSSENKFGIGDAAFQAYLAHDLDQNWAYGFGVRVVGPSAQDSLGSGKWQIMPGLGVRYSFTDLGPDTYFVPVIRYALSVAGDPTRRNIRQAQISPKLNIGLSERWFITLYPSYDVRINDGPAVPERHTVTVVPNGYFWHATTYASLSIIARAITGTSWNGPRFFGLRSGAEPRTSSEAANVSPAPNNKRRLIRAVKSHPAGAAASPLGGDGERRP
jgi:hypothetical protein